MFSVKIKYSFIIFAVISVLVFDLQVIFYAVLCMAIHEISHIVSAKLCGHNIKSLELSAQGLTIDLMGRPCGYKNFIIIVSGPLINLLCSAIYVLISRNSSSLFVSFNQSFGLFNLIPLKFLDGGRLLGEMLDICFDSQISTKISLALNTVFLLVTWSVSIYLFLFEDSHSISMFFCVFSIINLCIDDNY